MTHLLLVFAIIGLFFGSQVARATETLREQYDLAEAHQRLLNKEATPPAEQTGTFCVQPNPQLVRWIEATIAVTAEALRQAEVTPVPKAGPPTEASGIADTIKLYYPARLQALQRKLVEQPTTVDCTFRSTASDPQL